MKNAELEELLAEAKVSIDILCNASQAEMDLNSSQQSAKN